MKRAHIATERRLLFVVVPLFFRVDHELGRLLRDVSRRRDHPGVDESRQVDALLLGTKPLRIAGSPSGRRHRASASQSGLSVLRQRRRRHGDVVHAAAFDSGQAPAGICRSMPDRHLLLRGDETVSAVGVFVLSAVCRAALFVPLRGEGARARPAGSDGDHETTRSVFRAGCVVDLDQHRHGGVVFPAPPSFGSSTGHATLRLSSSRA